MKLLRKILFPVVPIYYMVTWLRNKLYDLGIKHSRSYQHPIICVGNLSVGGTGKTPMIEYLIKLLKSDYKIATLSRGYKRKTGGFIIANETSDASSVGDEPFQFYKKFKDIIVSVDANRQNGIEQLLLLQSKPDVILLDDAFQHRKVKAGFNILLTAYDDLYSEDMVLPTGNLREPKSGAKRADIIVVTKCPENVTDFEKQEIKGSLKPEKNQHVFFSSIVYSSTIKNTIEEKPLDFLDHKEFTLVTGIANPKPLIDFLNSKDLNFEHLNFNDHHEFSEKEIETLKSKGLILTTEKDFVRLEQKFENSEKLYYLPIAIEIDTNLMLDKQIVEFVSSY